MSIDRSLRNQFNFFILICIFVRPDWLLVRSKLASGLTNDLPIGKNYLQACRFEVSYSRVDRNGFFHIMGFNNANKIS